VISDVAATLFAGTIFRVHGSPLRGVTFADSQTLVNELAGADTTLSTVQTLFLAMVNFPEAQHKAQEELDRVLQGRLPQLGDEVDLPYTTAIVKEVLRWQPVTPLGAFSSLTP